MKAPQNSVTTLHEQEIPKVKKNCFTINMKYFWELKTLHQQGEIKCASSHQMKQKLQIDKYTTDKLICISCELIFSSS